MHLSEKEFRLFHQLISNKADIYFVAIALLTDFFERDCVLDG